ncbi:interleukin-17 receptor B isoform X2 [Brienomyrus brachyistius]|nr:interleukin-17 receptor B isoform X2 [Brienomyrus brachyistius]XP_048873769.1 interleukin-17 receptor B isoform X2 [Brienomyrus brachyistius]
MLNLNVSLIESCDTRLGHSELLLNISWAINIDKSNVYLTGTWLNINEVPYCCEYHPPISAVNTSGYEKLWFHFTEFVAEPEKDYVITGSNLPPPMIGSEPVSETAIFETSGCHTEKMKYCESCIKKGSLWEPNITTAVLKNEVKISFTSSPYINKYLILLLRLSGREENIINAKECNTGNDEARWSETLNFTGTCESLMVVVQPDTSRPQASVEVSCSMEGLASSTNVPDNSSSLWIGICCATFAVVLLAACISVLCKAHGTYSPFPKLLEDSGHVSVLIIYPAKSRAFQRAVVTLAEFLTLHCGCDVIIDVWQRRSVAEKGLLRWLTEHIKSAERVVFTTTKGQGNTGGRPDSGLADFTVPASVDDMFALALNVLASQAKEGLNCSKYFTVHLGEDLDLKNLPVALTMCRSFRLMTDLDKLCRQLHGNLSRRTTNFPFIGYRLGLLQGQDNTAELRDAIKELQTWEDEV